MCFECEFVSFVFLGFSLFTLLVFTLICGFWFYTAVQDKVTMALAAQWSEEELVALKQAVALHGRDWVKVSERVGTKTNRDCQRKAAYEVARGRMSDLGGRQFHNPWSKVELVALNQAVTLHGRNWVTVARRVMTKTKEQCKNKVKKEVAAGRMEEPGGKREQESWSPAELVQLKTAVDRHGRDWAAVSRVVGSKTNKQCWDKVFHEAASGRMEELGGKQEQESWSQAELVQLKAAIDRHGRDWVSVSRGVVSKTNEQCRRKVRIEVAAGRMQEPGGKREQRARVMEPGRADPTQGSG